MSRHRFAQAAPWPDHELNPRHEPALHVPYREFGTMTPADYAEIGFMCGLEVHQQLVTARKLFCRCPAGLRVTQVDCEVLRHMRPTLSELGLYDGTALMEFKTRKEIVYLLERSTTCTYELDDTPPFEIDVEAIKIALEVSRLYGMSLVSELQVMRKQYLDGSIPTGFQRSVMVSVGGSIPFRDSELGPGRQLTIRQLTVEEDACREVSDIGHRITFRTDRLGTPLIETVTEPELLTPHDVEAAARLLAEVARASGKVRRGAGAARQDVNVSVAGGRRVEIKGVCRHDGLPRLVHIEAFRQLELLRIREELRTRRITHEMLNVPPEKAPWETGLSADARPALRGCGYPPIEDAIARGDFLAVIRLPRFGDLLGREIQPGMRFAHEFADRVRVIACLESRPFMIDSCVKDYALKVSTWKRVGRAVNADPEDALVVVWGPEQDVSTAAREVLTRGQEALVGVPPETRQAYADGTTGLERILPGPERMYPDTDTPPVPVLDEWIARVDANLPERPWDREDRYVGLGLERDVARRLACAAWAGLFDALAPAQPTTIRRLAFAFEKRLRNVWRVAGQRVLPAAEHLRPLVAALDSGRLRPEACEAVFDRLVDDSDADPASVLCEFLPDGTEEHVLDALMADMHATWTEAAAAGRIEARGDAAMRLAMGEVMPHVLGRMAPMDVHAAIERALAAPTGDAP